MNKLVYLSFVILVFTLSLVSAVYVNGVNSDTLYPGKTGKLMIDVKNDLDSDIKDVSLFLDLSNTPFSTIGSAEETIDEINDDDSDTFSFTLSAEIDANTGDYNIPYILTYKDSTLVKKGTVGVKVRANSNLDYSASFENPIVGERTKLTLRIINKGLGEAKFVIVTLNPTGYTLLSEDKQYIGSIKSDDYESLTYDTILNSKNPNVIATVEYEDLDGKKLSEDIQIPIYVYSQEQALKLGLTQKNNTPLIILVVIILVAVWLIIRSIRKSIRKKKSLAKNGN